MRVAADGRRKEIQRGIRYATATRDSTTSCTAGSSTRKLMSEDAELLIKERLGGEAIELLLVHDRNVAEGLSETHEEDIRRFTDCPATASLHSADIHMVGNHATESRRHYWQAAIKGMQHCTGSGLQGP